MGASKSALKGFAGIFAVGVVVQGLKSVVAEAREAQKVGAITAQVIKTTGGAANVTAGQVSKLATAISNKTGVDDEAIQKGSNLLLTFKNVRNEVGKGKDIFNQATQAAVDLSAAGFGSIDSASKMLGKALNDPIKGMTALGRAGVTFTKGQQSQIKALVKSGDLLGAQKIILGEVKSQTGGAAAASATAGEKMKTAWNNAKESLGTALLPALDKLQIFITTKIIPAITKFVGFLQKNPGVVKAFGIALAVVAGVLLAIFIAANALIIGVGLLVVAFALVAGWIIKNWDKIKAKTVSIWNGIKTFLANVWNWIKTRPGVVWSWIKAKISGAWDAIKNKTKTTWDAIKNWIRDKLIQMGDAVRDKIRAIIQWFKDLPGKVKTALGNLKNTLLNAGKNLVQGFIDGIKNKFAAVKSKLTELKNKLTSWKGPPSADRVLLTRNGQLIIEGLIRGFESRKPAVRSSLRGMTSTIGSLPASGFAGPRMSSVGPAAPAGPMTATLVDPTIRVEKDGLVRLVDTRININDHAGALRTRFA